MSFLIASFLCFKNAVEQANFLTLEPVVDAVFSVPKQYSSKIEDKKMTLSISELLNTEEKFRKITNNQYSLSIKFSHYKEIG